MSLLCWFSIACVLLQVALQDLQEDAVDDFEKMCDELDETVDNMLVDALGQVAINVTDTLQNVPYVGTAFRLVGKLIELAGQAKVRYTFLGVQSSVQPKAKHLDGSPNSLLQVNKTNCMKLAQDVEFCTQQVLEIKTLEILSTSAKGYMRRLAEVRLS
jgi:hypothetical protein